MEGHRCKLCFRNFANGRALGGHMRSHMMNFDAAKNSSKNEEEGEQIPSEENFQEFDEFQSVHSYSSPSSYSSSSSLKSPEEEEEEKDDEENSKESPVFVDQEFSVVLQDGESETESSKNKPFCRRSKRFRKSRTFYSDKFATREFSPVKKSKFGEINEQSPLSSISDTTPEEDVAYCLMMLSRDKWKRENDYSEDSGVVKVKTTKFKGKYRCETCNKLFRSYQALGGHRASHKKMVKVNEAAPSRQNGGGDPVAEAAAVVEEKIHECPFCHRVFASGQALGGHKRSHFIGAATNSANINTISPVKQFSRTEKLEIDLNLPAAIDDADEIGH